MKTLYVSDLDGTLLNSATQISAKSARLLNDAISKGALFTIATARTPATVAPILKDIDMQLPAIVMTGATLWDTHTHRYHRKRCISTHAAKKLIEIYESTLTSSFVYTLSDEMIEIYHVGGPLTELQRAFMEERINNPFKRFHISSHPSESLLPEELKNVILMYSMLPDAKAASTYELTRQLDNIRPQYYHDIYGPEIGILEAFSSEATKAKALMALAAETGADRIVAFGDNINDLPMLEVADVAVAVENALPEVKDVANIVIGNHDTDAVARFISEDFLSNQ